MRKYHCLWHINIDKRKTIKIHLWKHFVLKDCPYYILLAMPQLHYLSVISLPEQSDWKEGSRYTGKLWDISEWSDRTRGNGLETAHLRVWSNRLVGDWRVQFVSRTDTVARGTKYLSHTIPPIKLILTRDPRMGAEGILIS